MFKCFPPNSFTGRVWPPVTGGGQLQQRLEKWLPPAVPRPPSATCQGRRYSSVRPASSLTGKRTIIPYLELPLPVKEEPNLAQV